MPSLKINKYQQKLIFTLCATLFAANVFAASSDEIQVYDDALTNQAN